MGYTHYWRRVKELDAEKFDCFIADCTEIINGFASLGIPLAGFDGTGEPKIRFDSISFNGLEACGHPRRNLGITWPADDAAGVGGQDDQVVGSWFAGATLQRRSCGGDCSHETFAIPRVYEGRMAADDNGRYFDCCKTAYKPYDLAVIMCLLVAKHHFCDDIVVSSDGVASDWADGVEAVDRHFGYKVVAPTE